MRLLKGPGRLAEVEEGIFTATAADGCRLAGRVSAPCARPAVILAHPIGFDGRFWDPVAHLLGDHFRLVIPDARGHGRSGRGGGETTIDQLAGDVLTVMDALGLEQSGFIGCSMGSAVGMRLAASCPERIEWAVLANAPARIALPREVFDQRIAGARTGDYPILARAMLSRWIAPGAEGRGADWFAARLDEMLQTDGEGFADALAALRDSDRNADLPQIRSRALVVAGALDEGFPPSAAAAMAQAIPAGQAAVIAGAGHLTPAEAPQAFSDLVLEFVRDSSGSEERRAGDAPARSSL